MKDTNDRNPLNGRQRPDRDESLSELMSSYTPKQRETFLKGFRILAQVAVRAHMKRQGDADAGDPAGDGGEEQDGG